MYHYTEQDKARFSEQTQKVVKVISCGQWKTLYDIANEAGIRNAGSVASRLRDLKAKWGWDYAKRRVGEGVWEYRAWPVADGQMSLI